MVFISPWFVVSFIRRSLPDVILALTASLEVNAVRVTVMYCLLIRPNYPSYPYSSMGRDLGMRLGFSIEASTLYGFFFNFLKILLKVSEEGCRVVSSSMGELDEPLVQFLFVSFS